MLDRKKQEAMEAQIADGLAQEILCICVNYHNEQETARFVRGLLGQRCSNLLRVVIVDNSDGEGPRPAILEVANEDTRVRLMHPGKNLGYYGAASWAFEMVLAEGARLPDWVVVSNTDIFFSNRHVLCELFSLYPGKAPAVLAPRILSTRTGVDQNPQIRERPSKARWRIYTWVFRYYPVFMGYQLLCLAKNWLLGFIEGRRFSGERGAKDEKGATMPIYAPHGSFVIFHRSFFEAGGDLKHGAFMFGETITIAETLRRLGLKAVYDPRISVLHEEHATTGLVKNRQIARMQWKASVHCFNQFFRTG
ncbi:MAG: glycosyltransferase [Thermodesulfobacteriota bacterium]|nr:glycosyltransferase [Thermodesulfobacteriota bacterium]